MKRFALYSVLALVLPCVRCHRFDDEYPVVISTHAMTVGDVITQEDVGYGRIPIRRYAVEIPLVGGALGTSPRLPPQVATDVSRVVGHTVERSIPSHWVINVKRDIS